MQHRKVWTELAKSLKETFVKADDRGELLPVVGIEKDGRIERLVIAPALDKHLGLIAARVLWHGFKPDAVVMVVDAHVKMQEVPEGVDPETIVAQYKPGEMQRMCDEENACDAGLITDILLVHRLDKTGAISAFSLPYAYHGKSHPAPFRWLDEEASGISFDETDGTKVAGMIPDALREIIAEAPNAETLAFILLDLLDYKLGVPAPTFLEALTA